MPLIDTLRWNNLEHIGYAGDIDHVGIFEWGFLFKEMTISKQDFQKKKHPSEPNWYCFALKNWNSSN